MGIGRMFGRPDVKTGGDTNSAQAPAKTAAPARKSGVPSIISADLQVVGDLASQGDLQVDGAVQGDVRAQSVTIGENAQVRGSINAEFVRVCGSVIGQIQSKRVELTRTARVTGDIAHEALAIESGAFIEGNCRRLDAPREAAPESRGRGDGVVNLADAVPNPLAQKQKGAG